MENSDVEKIKGRYTITRNNDYVILSGDSLYVVSPDGTLIAHRNEFRNIYKAIFLSNNRLLIDCGCQKSYVLLSLEDCSELWRIAKPKADYTSNCFALSPDGAFVYDYCYIKETPLLVSINLEKQEIQTNILCTELRSISDLICNEEGFPCLLQHHYDIISNSHVSINGIRCERRGGATTDDAAVWKHRWFFDFPQISCFFLGNADTILTEDLFVFEPQSRVMYNLLENDPDWMAPGKRPSECRIDLDNRYITLMYKMGNIVIDWHARKIVAQYSAQFRCGCVVGDEYWISSDSGVRRMPFPFMETIPNAKPSFWNPLSSSSSK